MADQKGLAGDADYIAPSKPGEMHGHATYGQRQTMLAKTFGTGRREEGAVAKERTTAMDSLVKSGMPDNWSPRDTNLPVEKRRPSPTRSAQRKVSAGRR